MKQKLLMLLCAMMASAAQAQTPLVFNSTNMPTVPYDAPYASDTLLTGGFSIGQAGANRTWNYAGLAQHTTSTIFYRAPTSGQQSNFPTADYSITTDNVNYLFGNLTSTLYEIVGLDGNANGIQATIPFSTPSKQSQFPSTFNTNFTGTSAFTKTLNNVNVNGTNVYEVKITVNSTYSDTIDGWGKLVTPLGSYKALRKKRKETTTTLIQFRLCQSTLICPFQNAPGYPQTQTRTTHSWIAKEAKGAVLTLGYDSTGNIIKSATYSTIPPAMPTPNFGFASGGGGLIIFTDSTDGYPDRYSWNFGDGDTSNLQNPNHIYQANNTYNVCLTVYSRGSSAQICKNVVVSGIVAANNPPFANDDTASVTQPNSKLISPLANDLDPDANSLSLASRTAPANGTTTVSINDINYTPNPGFTGVDSFTYVVCDNGSPSLCDTAKIRVTVFPQPILPVADFTYTQSNCSGGQFVNASTAASSVSWTFTDLAGTVSPANFSTDTVDFDAVQNREVEVCITATNNFGTDTYCDTVILNCVGVQETGMEAVNLFPNPAQDQLQLQWTNTALNQAILQVVDLKGAVVKQMELNEAGQLVLPVNDLPEGTYMLTIRKNDALRFKGRFTKIK